MKQKRIVCAACRLDNTVVTGARHWDAGMHKLAYRVYLGESYAKWEWDQGFIDQHNVFLTRTEAWKIAEAAGQILYRVGGDTTDGGTLYSENLY